MITAEGKERKVNIGVGNMSSGGRKLQLATEKTTKFYIEQQKEKIKTQPCDTRRRPVNNRTDIELTFFFSSTRETWYEKIIVYFKTQENLDDLY